MLIVQNFIVYKRISQACSPSQTQDTCIVHCSLEPSSRGLAAAPDELQYFWQYTQSARWHYSWLQNTLVVQLPTIICWVHIWRRLAVLPSIPQLAYAFCTFSMSVSLVGLDWIGLCSVLRPLQHSTGYMGDGITGWWKRAEFYWWCTILPCFGVPHFYAAFSAHSIKGDDMIIGAALLPLHLLLPLPHMNVAGGRVTHVTLSNATPAWPIRSRWQYPEIIMLLQSTFQQPSFTQLQCWRMTQNLNPASGGLQLFIRHTCFSQPDCLFHS